MIGLRITRLFYSLVPAEEELQQAEIDDKDLDEQGIVISRCSKPHTSRTLLLIVLVQTVLLSLTILTLVWVLQQAKIPISEGPQDELSAVEDYRQLEVYNTTVILGIDEPQATLQSPENNRVWAELRPLYGGIVRFPTKHAQAMGLPSSATLEPLYPEDGVYQIAVFHQLHCLGMIRDQLTLAETDRSVKGSKDHNHILHCVEYLRKILLCNTDVTLDPTTDYYYYGTNSSRQCRDWDALRTWWHRNKFHEFESFLETKPEPQSHLDVLH